MTCYIAGVDVEWPFMKVIITFTFYCDNLWKSLENLGNFFLLLYGHPVKKLWMNFDDILDGLDFCGNLDPVSWIRIQFLQTAKNKTW